MIDRDTALAEARAELGRGECLRAHDIASAALGDHPEDRDLSHVAILSLARSGATGQALARFEQSALGQMADEEVLGLKARLAKDLALQETDEARVQHIRTALDIYCASHAQKGGYYPAINVAFLHLLAGETDDARSWAATALSATGDDQSYYAEATRAEALLILGRVEDAGEALQSAVALDDASIGNRSTTWKQLRLVCRETGINPKILTPLKPPPVLHFCGHIIAAPGQPGRFPADQAAEVQTALDAFFAEHQPGRVFGSLAAGADILIAETALAHGADLVAILPFAAEEFEEISVAGSGADWTARFRTCLAAASEVHFVTPDAWLGDNALFGYATQYAIGLARQHADWLRTDALQLLVWDGEDGPNAAAGTGHDRKLGAAAGMIQTVVPVRSTALPRSPQGEPATPRRDRQPMTMIFGDLKGFSKLTDAQMPAYVDTVLGAIARTLDGDTHRPLFRNTWGDGIYLVFDDPGDAAACGFALQDAIREAVQNSDVLPDTLGLRLGMHYGPVYAIEDPVMGARNFFGAHVSHAARTEPRTPEGEIYVTSQTAAALALSHRERFRCEYVGRIPLAKGHGSFPMYHLRRLGS